MQVITASNQYSSGMRRLVAFLIDHFLISAALGGLFWNFWGWPFGDYYFPFEWDSWTFRISFVSHNAMMRAFFITYCAAMEASKFEATIGKIVMGIRVQDANGQRLDIGKTLLRNASKLLSQLLLGIGYIMIIFDDRKQGLHDKIADTFVVRQ